ncbi:MAG: symmetrical bis(5'-nucleosyl)-tetraphosphatase [Thiohalomonadales bacterium]
MSLYVIGDIQGCYDSLRELLRKIAYNGQYDQLWFTGDLVNRGPKSLETLRFIKSLKNSVVVLGNHDLHLLAVAYAGAKQSQYDTLDPILEAPDRESLLTWLRQRPLLHHDRRRDLTLIHAGLAPQWSLDVAKKCAAEVEQVLQGQFFINFL